MSRGLIRALLIIAGLAAVQGGCVSCPTAFDYLLYRGDIVPQDLKVRSLLKQESLAPISGLRFLPLF